MAANLLARLGSGIGTGLGEGLSQGLEQLSQHKLGQMKANNLSQMLQKLNVPAEEANLVPHLSPKAQEEYFSQVFSRGGFQQQQNPQQTQMSQALESLSSPQQQVQQLQGQQQAQQQRPQQPVQGMPRPSGSPLARPTLKEQEAALKQSNLERKEAFAEKKLEEAETKDWAKALGESRSASERGLRGVERTRKLLKHKSTLSHPLAGSLVKFIGAKGYGPDLRSQLKKNTVLLGTEFDKLITELAAATGYRPSATLLDLVERAKGSISLTPEQNEQILDGIESEFKQTIKDYDADKKIVNELGYRPRDVAGRIAELQLNEERGGPTGQIPNEPQQQNLAPEQVAQNPQEQGEESLTDNLLRQATRTTFRATESIGDLTKSALPLMIQAIGAGGPIGSIAAPYLQEAYKHVAPTSSPKGYYKKLIEEAKHVLEPQNLLETIGDKVTKIAVPLLVTGTPAGQALKMAFGGVLGGEIGGLLDNEEGPGLGRTAGELGGMFLGGRVGSKPKITFGQTSMAFSPETVELETAMGNMFDEGARVASKIEVPAKDFINDLSNIRSEINEFKTPASKEMNQLIDSIIGKQKYTPNQGMTITASDITKGIKRINSLFPGATGETKKYLHDISNALKKQIPAIEAQSPEFKRTYSAANEVYKAFRKSAGESEATIEKMDKVAEKVSSLPLKHGWLRSLVKPVYQLTLPKSRAEAVKLRNLTKNSPVAKKFLIDLAQAKIAKNANAMVVAMRNLDQEASKYQ